MPPFCVTVFPPRQTPSLRKEKNSKVIVFVGISMLIYCALAKFTISVLTPCIISKKKKKPLLRMLYWFIITILACICYDVLFCIRIRTRRGIYCICIRTRQGIYGQIYPFAWRSSWGKSPMEHLNIPSQVLIRTIPNFNNHYANDSLINLIKN